MTRIIAGQARGRRLRVPRGDRVRPTADRVRESIFAALGSHGDLTGAAVLDAFAGSGALGLEALSRGAAHATFVERHRGTAAVLEANIAALDFGDRCRVVRGDALRWLATAGESFDVAFCDPPYDFPDHGWERLLGRLRANILVVESDRAVPAHPAWLVISERRRGSTVVQMATPRTAGDDETSAAAPGRD
ncbi:MAG: 16S rRNA (guanine(966)-N(2))-methyltransferase RsmD [Acidimicrobiia bacterium]|nr:16S rRNA (guanine(966)-N(2))-methyltransferase RsmD [Acidimicrobiia bacterium]MYB24982.1 16S rRNA (guanine(966)-N(2))-methyltransferase RsmD [Acidimicrobiia bacterium]MYJ13552.1 16S rRNA (guanine(966)-N(2))-methyltransferase RsmD [Acidimicrobiia bacterium]